MNFQNQHCIFPADIIGRIKKHQCPCVNSCEKVEFNVQATSSTLDLDIQSIDDF